MKKSNKPITEPMSEVVPAPCPGGSAVVASAAREVTALRLLVTTLLSIFVAEALVMSLLSVLPPFSGLIETIIDASLLSVLAFPSLYFLSFRPLVASIKTRKRVEQELVKYQERLEDLVQDRTHQLSLTNAKLREEIAQRQQTEAELKTAHQRLAETVHSAATAEVAAEALHNVANVLNSINVSTTVIAERMAKSEMTDLYRVTDIINEHIDDIAPFLTEHPQGKHIPTYLAQAGKYLHDEQIDMIAKLKALTESVQHVKDIIDVQQSSARVSGLHVRTTLAQIAEDAIQINSTGLQGYGIGLVRRFDEPGEVEIDRQRVLQILVNLISNAKHALILSKTPDKLLTIRISRGRGDCLRVEIIDNGIGIPRENLSRIFTHGFTTKQNGHGFGLHSSALAAGELGGSLTVHSAGTEQGATFTLELPFKPARAPQ